MRGLAAAVRRLARAPGASLAAAGTLGIGVAASTVVLAFGHAALIQPVARFPDRHRIVDILATRGRGADDRFAVYPADFLAWRARQRSFQAFGAYVPIGEVDLTGRQEPQRLRSHRVTAGLFPALGIRPERGRNFTVDEEEPGRDRVTILSHHLWRRLGSDPAILGRTLVLNGEPHRVVGVMPPGFGVSGGFPDLWLPLSFGPGRPADRSSATLGVVGRLRAGVGLAQARADLRAIGAALEESFPGTNRDLRPSLVPLVEVMTRGLRSTVLLLLAAVGAVLAIAGVNLGNLLLARAMARDGEMAVRASLGAAPGRLARGVLAESLLIGGLAAVVGVALAAGTLELLPDLHGQFLYRSVELRLGAPVLALAAILALGVGVLAGLAPALRAARAATRPRGGDGATATRGRRAALVGEILVAGQIASTLALLTASGLLLRSLAARLDTDLGFRAAGVLSFEVAPPPSRYPGAAELGRFSARLLAELRAIPGVGEAAASDGLPAGGWTVRVRTAASPPAGDPQAGPPRAALRLVTPGYFRVLGMPLLAGRGVLPSDAAGAPPVAILSRSAARRLFGDESPLGRRVSVEEGGAAHLVVGVVPDVRRSAADPPRSTLYLAYAQHAALLDTVGVRTRLVLLRTRLPPAALAPALRRSIARLDADLATSPPEPLAGRLAAGFFRPRLASRLLAGFAAVALALAALGLFALFAQAVSRRRREIGIRVAIGAGPGEVLRLLTVPAARLTAAGLALGTAAALALGRAMAGLLFAVTPHDPRSLAAAVATLAVAMLLALAVPARRALRVDPREALATD